MFVNRPFTNTYPAARPLPETNKQTNTNKVHDLFVNSRSLDPQGGGAVDGRDGCRKPKAVLVLQARLGGVQACWGLEGGLRRRGRRLTVVRWM